MCGEEEKKREKETMKAPREEAELPLHLMKNRSKPDLWASGSYCLENPHCKDCYFIKAAVPPVRQVLLPSHLSPKSLLASESPASQHVGQLGYM